MRSPRRGVELESDRPFPAERVLMADNRSGSSGEEPQFFTDELDEMLSRANPNPERLGCPDRSILEALARRELPISDPGYRHLVECSPCYREFHQLRKRSVR